MKSFLKLAVILSVSTISSASAATLSCHVLGQTREITAVYEQALDETGTGRLLVRSLGQVDDRAQLAATAMDGRPVDILIIDRDSGFSANAASYPSPDGLLHAALHQTGGKSISVLCKVVE